MEIVIARDLKLEIFGHEMYFSYLKINKTVLVIISISSYKSLLLAIRKIMADNDYDYDGGGGTANGNGPISNNVENSNIILKKDENEGSSSKSDNTTSNTKGGGGSNVASSSKNESSSQTGRVITDSDFEADSSSDESISKHYGYESDYSEDPTESRHSRIVNSNLNNFLDQIENLDSNDLVETLETINAMEKEYATGKSSSAQIQLDQLEVKKSLCEQELGKRLAEEEASQKETSSKGKGKSE